MKRLFIFDLDGVLTYFKEYYPALENYYRWFLQIPELTIEDYRTILTTNYYEGIQNLCDKYDAINPYIHHDQVDQRERELRLAAVEKARAEAGVAPGISEVIKELKRHPNTILAINSSAPTHLILASIGNLTFEFNYLGAGNDDADKNVTDSYDGIPRFQSRSKVEKFNWLQQQTDVALEQLYFFTDTLGDVRDACEFGFLHQNIIAVTWGVYSEQDFKDYAQATGCSIRIANTPQELLLFIE